MITWLVERYDLNLYVGYLRDRVPQGLLKGWDHACLECRAQLLLRARIMAPEHSCLAILRAVLMAIYVTIGGFD